MSSAIRSITIDSADPYELALFWSKVTGHPLNDDDHPGDPEALVMIPGVRLLFVTVTDPKTVKNRVHVDLEPEDSREAEVERLLAVGARMVDDRREPDGSGWVVLADPEGNEFCVERSAAERARS